LVAFGGKKHEKKLSAWKGSSLSMAERITLINSSLSSTFIYHMSIYLLPTTTTKTLDKQRRRFLWQGNSLKKVPPSQMGEGMQE